MPDPRRIPEPSDPWVEAVAFAIREAYRLHAERAARRATLSVIEGSKRGGETR